MIPANELYQEINRQVDALGIARPSDVKVLDWGGEYRLVPVSVWRTILAWSDIDRYDYESSLRDCDDFAKGLWAQCPIRLLVNGIGLVLDWSGGHAYNILPTFKSETPGDLILAFVEPQTDRWVAVGEELSGTEAYKLRHWELLL